MLTSKEKKLVIGWMREYPQGIYEGAWGSSSEFIRDSECEVTDDENLGGGHFCPNPDYLLGSYNVTMKHLKEYG